MDDLRPVSPAEAQRLMDAGAILLDVRTDDEWSAGRAPGARHIALAELPDHLDELNGASGVVCVCRSGHRSARATEYLREHGVNALNLEGGMLAWVESGVPLESDGDEPTVA